MSQSLIPQASIRWRSGSRRASTSCARLPPTRRPHRSGPGRHRGLLHRRHPPGSSTGPRRARPWPRCHVSRGCFQRIRSRRLSRRTGSDASGEVTRLTDSLLSETTLIDPVGDAGIYDYRVLAQDSNDNLGDPSNTATARVHTPLLQQPFTPLAEPARFELVGRGVALASVSVPSTTRMANRRCPAAADSDGIFRLPDLVSRSARIASAYASPTVRPCLQRGERQRDPRLPPAPPSGLAADVAGYDVTLSWDDNSEADLFGYRIFRDGEDLLGDYQAVIAAADASIG